MQFVIVLEIQENSDSIQENKIVFHIEAILIYNLELPGNSLKVKAQALKAYFSEGK